jgi:hypothetical protein
MSIGRREHLLSLGLLTLGLLAACTDAELFGPSRGNRPDRTRIKGEVCTSDPAEREFPVKVLFLVDTSIGDSNYLNQRADSIQKLLRQYSGANYSFGVIRYAGPLAGTVCGFRNLTPDGFSKFIDDAILGVRCTDAAVNPGRDLSGALSLANSVISGDVLQSSRGLRSRTKYVIILLANGPPTTSLQELWCGSRVPRIPLGGTCSTAYFQAFCENVQPQPQDCERYQYTRIVRGMRELALTNGTQEFYFHIVYQRDPDMAAAAMDDPVAITLYTDMTLSGGGTLYRVANGGLCDAEGGNAQGCIFSNINLDSTESVFVRKQLIVANRNSLPTGRGLKADSDGDGLDDDREINELGTDPRNADTDGDFLSDKIEVMLAATGLNPLLNNLNDNDGDGFIDFPLECPVEGISSSPNAFLPDEDSDGDGLTNCEEILLRSDTTLFDSDADGIPDPIEFRLGSNMISDDTLDDTDNDGLSNLAETRFHLSPIAKDPTTDGIYRYSIRDERQADVISYTQPFQASGVYVVSVSPNSSDGRATIYFQPPADPTQPVSETNPALLAWRDPTDDTPSGSTPGRGPDVFVTADGVYTLHSGASDPLDPEKDLSITVQVVTTMFRDEPVVNDIRLRTSRRTCFEFEVANIALKVTAPRPDTGVEGVNFIDVFLAETPSNNPNSFGIFRVATRTAVLPPLVEDRYPQPDIELTDQDFLLYGD